MTGPTIFVFVLGFHSFTLKFLSTNQITWFATNKHFDWLVNMRLLGPTEKSGRLVLRLARGIAPEVLWSWVFGRALGLLVRYTVLGSMLALTLASLIMATGTLLLCWLRTVNATTSYIHVGLYSTWKLLKGLEQETHCLPCACRRFLRGLFFC